MKTINGQTKRLNGDSRETWIEYGKVEGENWIKNLANNDALRVAVNASDFDDAEESLTRQDDYQYDYFKNNFRYAFQEILAVEDQMEATDWDCEEYQLFKQGWIEAVKKFKDDLKRSKL